MAQDVLRALLRNEMFAIGDDVGFDVFGDQRHHVADMGAQCFFAAPSHDGHANNELVWPFDQAQQKFKRGCPPRAKSLQDGIAPPRKPDAALGCTT